MAVRHFARRMLPAALAAGMVVAAVPPLTYRIVGWRTLGEQASVYAGQIAGRLGAIATRQPLFWRYNAGKAIRATAPYRQQADIGAVRVTDCAGATLFSPKRLDAGTGQADGPAAWVPVLVGGRAVGGVEVAMDTAGPRAALVGIGGASSLLGALMAALLYLFPTRVVRRQAARLRGGAQVIGVQEEERRRIARDLHDGVGQLLTGLRMDLELAETRPEERPRRLEAGLAACDETMEELRRVVHDLMPPELVDTPLSEVLRGCTERFELRTGIPTSFRAPSGLEVSPEAAVCLLRVLQEALANVSRHAEAAEVGVAIDADATGLTLVVTDDGRGFDSSAPTSGTGLKGIRERCGFLGGSVALESAPSEGTKVAIRLPQGPGLASGS